MNKQFAVLGLGSFGRSVALSLVNLGCDVLVVDDSYEKKWQGENNDEEHDIYYIEENGIHLCPNGYSLGDLGQCWGQSIDITIEKDGYRIDVVPITEF